MANIKLDTGFNIEVDFVVTTFMKRLLAWSIDLLVIWAYIKIMALMFRQESFFVWIGSNDLKGILISLPALFYHFISEVFLNGRSIGKMALRLQVIAQTGGEPSLSQYLLRWCLRLIDFPLVLLGLIASGEVAWWLFPFLFSGLFTVILTPGNQRLGDLIAGTLIVDLSRKTSWEETVFTELDKNYQPSYPQVMQLTDRDINTVKSIIDTVKKKGDSELSHRIASRIRNRFNIEYREDPLEFLETLLKDYNYYTHN
jgi:uncharacterized RDD family membrane protein YckC